MCVHIRRGSGSLGKQTKECNVIMEEETGRKWQKPRNAFGHHILAKAKEPPKGVN
jgi:hypothetical protein